MKHELSSSGVHRIWCSNTEELGIMMEKMICGVCNIQFNSRRKAEGGYTDVPQDVVNDITLALKRLTARMRVQSHVGHENTAADFLTSTQKTVSIKTIMTGDRICPHNIGQCTFRSFCRLHSIQPRRYMVKKFICRHTHMLVNQYIEHAFACDYLIVCHFAKNTVYCLRKISQIPTLVLPSDCSLYTKRSALSWKNYNSVVYNSNGRTAVIGSIEIDGSGKRVKFRFILRRLIELVNSGAVTNVHIDEYKLRNKYKLRVSKTCHQTPCATLSS